MYFKTVKKKMRSDSAAPSCLHMTQPSAATVWLDLSLFIWPAEIQDLVYSNQKKNWRWTETSSEQPLLRKNIFKPYFLPTGSPEPLHSQIWTSFSLLLGWKIQVAKSGVTPLARQRPVTPCLVRFLSYPAVQSSTLAEVQRQCCHPALLPAVPKATLCHICARLSPSTSLGPLEVFSGKEKFWLLTRGVYMLFFYLSLFFLCLHAQSHSYFLIVSQLSHWLPEWIPPRDFR